MTISLDNCNAQCKNWYIYTSLAVFINSSASELVEITLKYFEKGHTFMSADSYHHMVEKLMNDMGSVFDFDEWIKALNQHGRAVILQGEDCLKVKRGLSQGKHVSMPHIEDIQQAQFVKGSSKLFWKESMEDESYSHSEFLQVKYMNMIQKGVNWPPFLKKYTSDRFCRGISHSKKENINTKLCPLMPHKCRSFWVTIPCCDDRSESEEDQ